jgi:glucose/arabinose dehydrogenase
MGTPDRPARTPIQRRRRVLRNAGIFLAMGLAPASCEPQCQPPTPAPAPVRYDVATVATGLENPWDLAFTPDGTALVTERSGDVNVLVGGVGQRIGRPGDVVAQGEGGMMGLAVDPGFGTANHYIYTCYLTSADVRVVRFTVGAGYSSLSEPLPLVVGMPRSSSGRHSGCRVRIAPDTGLLWITTGDAAVGTNPQNLASLGGKVLRIGRDGSIPAGNMTGPGVRGEIYAYGFRNPQGITFRAGDNIPFLIEHGSDRDDEVTQLVAGGNGGWHPIPGYNEQVPMTDLARFPDALRPAWTSGNPTIAPSGGTFVTSAQWGGLANGAHIVLAVLKGQELRLIATNGNQSTILTGQGRMRVAVEAPDGNLWVLTDATPTGSNPGGGRVLAVTPVR